MSLPADEPNDEERLEELPGDEGETPFSPGGPLRDDEPDREDITAKRLDSTHPVTDDGIEPGGVYEDGLAEEAGAEEPNAGNTVVSYDPAKDKRNKPK